MRIEDADKKKPSILYLALGNEGERIFRQKFPKVKLLQISFKEFWAHSNRFCQENKRLIRKAQVVKKETTRQRVT